MALAIWQEIESRIIHRSLNTKPEVEPFVAIPFLEMGNIQGNIYLALEADCCG